MTRDEVLKFLIDNAMALKMIQNMGRNSNLTLTPDDRLVDMAEGIIVQATAKRNEHDREHGENYKARCLFCVEQAKESNR